MLTIQNLSIILVLAPLVGCLIAGLFRKQVGPRGAHTVTILGVAISFLISLYFLKVIVFENAGPLNFNIYEWVISGNFQFHVGFLIDPLSVMMITTVTFVSLLVHIYSVGYMAGDPGYQRFFSYISLFTFAMLMLVLANNFMQLFFGWEGVGVASYLLIGFWFKRDSANAGSLKAFLVNRVGDFGFILGISAILTYFGTIDYAQVFAIVPTMAHTSLSIIPGVEWSLITVICLLLLIGAMGKSAQVPLHVWLPESMEGPTPISALIHAATMVTAGIYMVSRMSPLFELSTVALSTVLIIGATGALFTGLLGVVQNDIKRVVAYSTLSQLGYMMAALGASAYAAGLFHLFTHAAFKALLFLGAGSVIIAMHHEQDMRKMGGLYKYMPITYVTFLIGSLALTAIPPFSGFFSKDAIIEAIGLSTIPGSSYAYFAVVAGAFVTALYSFRAFFLTFHTKERMDHHTKEHLHESPWVVWLPLVCLAIPSMVLGYYMIEPILFAQNGLLGTSITVFSEHNVLATLGAEFHGAAAMMLHAVKTLPFWLSIAGIVTAWVFYVLRPEWPGVLARRFAWIYQILMRKYGFDDFNQLVFADGTRKVASFFAFFTDAKIIDGFFVNGSGRGVQRISEWLRRSQTGYLYHYAGSMVAGLLIFVCLLVF